MSDQVHSHNRGWRHHSRRVLILYIAIFFVSVGIIFIILKLAGVIRSSWVDIIPQVFTGLGVVFASLQWLFPVDPDSPIITSQHGSIRLRPTIEPTIIGRERDIEKIYETLSSTRISGIVLRGIRGIGKTTLAALVHQYAEGQRRVGNEPFMGRALWFYIQSNIVFSDFAESLFAAFRKSFPDFSGLTPQNQAEELFNLLNTTKKTRLVIIDFKNPLDAQTGEVLADRPGFSEWLTALNSQLCRCRVLLTNYPWPQRTSEYIPTYLQEYLVKGLGTAEGVELLQNLKVEATREELHRAVRRCDGHPEALLLLNTLLKRYYLSLTNFLEDSTYAQLWTENIAHNLFDRMNQVERDLLLAFSIYREPVPLNAAQAILDSARNIPDIQIQSALKTLLEQALLQDIGRNRYQLHAIVVSYAQNHFVEGNQEANLRALQAAHAKAVQYYLQQAAISCPPQGQRQNRNDVHFLIEAAWQQYHAGQLEEAYDLVQQEDILSYLV